ncbi:hypothetical protein SAMN02927903_03222 [Flavobacterium caeni]|uniref:Uncharacterized protein n=1 Tax=Flavobacterium caeni TaxID=490189 RepID=A0A1G5KCQ9_9FLAO|nr:hypothetical protein SAMN02927903_03222 [Flavobacterium caeni]
MKISDKDWSEKFNTAIFRDSSALSCNVSRSYAGAEKRTEFSLPR